MLDRASSVSMWTRLAALEPVCDIRMDLLWRPSGAEQRKQWKVVIRRRGEPGGPAVELVRASALEALSGGLAEAEARRWDTAVEDDADRRRAVVAA